jgi:hypothetical protein
MSSPIWDSWPDIYYCLTVAVLFLLGAVSDERTGLFLYMLLALARKVFLGSESLGTRDHTLLSQIWDFPFLASYNSQGHGGGIRPHLHTCTDSNDFLFLYNSSARTTQKTQPLYFWESLFNDPLPKNGRPIVGRVRFRWDIFTESLPNNESIRHCEFQFWRYGKTINSNKRFWRQLVKPVVHPVVLGSITCNFSSFFTEIIT